MDTLKKNTEAKLQAQSQARDAEAKAAALEKEKLENRAKMAELEKEKLEQAKKMQEWMDAMAAKGIDITNLPPLPGMGQSTITTSSSSQVKFSNVPADGKSGNDTTGAGAPPGPGAQ